jgi:aerobic carbon-monoxide dehydrogenase large subunit
VCAIVASIVLGKPVKWIEDRVENISSTAFARDYHMDGEIAATADGKITALRVNVVADHGAFDACADPTKFPAGLFHICSGSYDIPAALRQREGRVHQQGAGRRGLPLQLPRHRGGVPGRAHGGRAGAEAGHGQGRDPREELHQEGAVPVHSAFGFDYDSGDYHTALQKVLDAVDYKALRAEQAAKRADPTAPR